MQTKIIVETVSSQIDTNGNRYHYARFYNPEMGRQHSVVIEIGGPSNGLHIAHKMTGDWESTLEFTQTIPKREFMAAFKNVKLHEATPEAIKALASLFPNLAGAV